MGHTEFSWRAGTEGGGGGGSGELQAELKAEMAAAEKLRAQISDKEALIVLKKTLAEEKAAVAALQAKMRSS